METSKELELDATVLGFVQSRNGTKLVDLRGALGAGLGLDDRAIDKSLQRLRKAGKIIYVSQVIGWKAAVN